MNRTIGDIMERDVYTCRYDQNLGEIVALFNELGTSGLAVIDEDRHVVGFISDGDIMKAVAAQKTRSIFGGGYANMVPVSYTHLDVYKRQVPLTFLGLGPCPLGSRRPLPQAVPFPPGTACSPLGHRGLSGRGAPRLGK